MNDAFTVTVSSERLGEQNTKMLRFPVPLRACSVSFVDIRGIRHVAEVQAESLFEAAILGMRVFKGDPWIEHVGPATVFDVEVREPATRHAISLHQIQRWLDGASSSPNEGVKKAKLKNLLISR